MLLSFFVYIKAIACNMRVYLYTGSIYIVVRIIKRLYFLADS